MQQRKHLELPNSFVAILEIISAPESYQLSKGMILGVKGKWVTAEQDSPIQVSAASHAASQGRACPVVAGEKRAFSDRVLHNSSTCLTKSSKVRRLLGYRGLELDTISLTFSITW